MSESPASPTPYEVLGVSASASHDELRRAYRRLLRETHPDTGGSAVRFTEVQRAWELVGDPADRAAFDRGESIPDSAGATSGGSAGHGFSATFTAPSPRGTAVRARTYGHPGGQAREHYLRLMREWVGRGAELSDPYDPRLVRSAPREIRALLAKALAEEATARAVAGLGIGFTVWNDVAVHPKSSSKLDHVVLGPAGLFAVRSEDWGSEVKLSKGDIVGAGIADDEEPFHELQRDAKTFSRYVGVRFTGLIIVVPDSALAVPYDRIQRGRLAGALLVRRSLLPNVLRTGATGAERESVDRVFDLRTRLQEGIRFV
ncbi:DnaJ domain-containing protein [Diaminobutyricibacter tongyongensis]|uniref:DnaJ domain-containing protein n=1 Tax=Leifsonia tongyongensis TaxID=1268043 RepID=A0A6L9XXA6_9MICO|nr:nuclease-related domain-containing protein [Diaminobutyricibacter tongyongensis]NEN06060.1 DnaJ domain-containing protein [Diaminobutyricibacter tongyongensis]